MDEFLRRKRRSPLLLIDKYEWSNYLFNLLRSGATPQEFADFVEEILIANRAVFRRSRLEFRIGVLRNNRRTSDVITINNSVDQTDYLLKTIPDLLCPTLSELAVIATDQIQKNFASLRREPHIVENCSGSKSVRFDFDTKADPSEFGFGETLHLSIELSQGTHVDHVLAQIQDNLIMRGSEVQGFILTGTHYTYYDGVGPHDDEDFYEHYNYPYDTWELVNNPEHLRSIIDQIFDRLEDLFLMIRVRRPGSER